MYALEAAVSTYIWPIDCGIVAVTVGVPAPDKGAVSNILSCNVCQVNSFFILNGLIIDIAVYILRLE